MPFQLSPGVAVVEKDFSTIVPTVSSSAGAFCGPFAWGPVEDPVRISSETELVARFGAPKAENFQSFFTAANFLAYANNLLVTRTSAPNLKNAVVSSSGSVSQANVVLTAAGSGYVSSDNVTVTFSAPDIEGGTLATGTVVSSINGQTLARTITGITITNPGSGYTSAPTATISAPASQSGVAATAKVTQLSTAAVLIKNVSDYLSTFNGGAGLYGEFAAKFPGRKGNSLRVVMLDSGSWTTASTDVKALFNSAPGTSTHAAAHGIADDELHIAVIDTPTGTFSGVANSVLEKFTYVSKLSDAKRSDGSNNYYKSVVNSQSKYVWWMDHPALAKYSEFSSVNVVNNSLKALAVFSATNKSITISATSHFTNLASFKAFFDAAADKSNRKITVGGTTSNNGNFTVVSVNAIVDLNNDITGYSIVVKETVVNETAAATTIVSVEKAVWGQTAQDTASDVKVLKTAVDVVLSGGVDDFASTDSDIQNAYAMLTNAEQYDISLLPLGNVSALTAKWVVDNVAEFRKDCVVFVSPNIDGEPITSTGSTATDAIIAFRNDTLINSSYAVMDSGWKYQYDRYNDAYRWVPLSADIAGLCARTDYAADPWFSPGGFTRGQIKNIVKLAFNPNQSDRDVLYAAGVNPVVSFPGQGVILYGDKTMLSKPSAFDRINVRRLFIVLEKSIAVAAKYQLFEFNDSFTRAQFKNLVEPFLRDVQGRRGVTDFRVKCDEGNNTGEVIDRNEFVADIFIKPNRSINFITLNFVAARSSVSFDEIGG